jgi:hypothetical protein
MIVLDLSDDTVTLDMSLSRLKSNQLSQLHYWGLERTPQVGTYRLSAGRAYVVLLKVLGYFDKEGIPYSLTPSCQALVLNLTQILNRLEAAKASGRLYKQGDIDSTAFNEFVTFASETLPRRLKHHQLKAAFHLYLVQNGANFSVPGSGKTAVVLTVYEKLRVEGKVNVIYVVGPPACFGPWKTEFELTLGRKPDARILAGGEQVARKHEYFRPGSQKGELYLTTYQTLLNDQREVVAFLGQNGIDAFIVVDEAHYIKQVGGDWANAVLSVSQYARYRCALTGTPLPRSYVDLFNTFDYLWPDHSPLSSEAKRRIEICETNGDGASAKELLGTTIGPLFYRVRKCDLGLIPPVFHAPTVLKMNKYEGILYEAIETQIRRYAKEDYMRNIDLVSKLRRGRVVRLRQCVSYPKLLQTAVEDYREDVVGDGPDLRRMIRDYDALEKPAKLERLMQLVGHLHSQKQKAVIWAHFVGTLDLLAKHLTEAGFYCKLIYGATPTEQTSFEEEETRETIRAEFLDPKSGLDILIANPAACAESISLHTTCHHAVYYDLSYNCAQYLQSLDRIHRVGGSETDQANYHFLQYDHTIDQDIAMSLDRKASKMYALIEEDYAIYSLDMFGEDDELQAYERLFGEK